MLGTALLATCIGQSALATQKSRYTIVFHGNGTTHLRTLDNFPGAWHRKSNSTFVIGGDSNLGGRESLRVSKIRGADRHRPTITTQYVGGTRTNLNCPDGELPNDYNNPEKMARGQVTRQNQLCAKSYGIASIYSDRTDKEVLWAWFSPGNGKTGYRSSTLMYSETEGKSWKKGYTMWTQSKRVIHPSFMSAGPGYSNTGRQPSQLTTRNGRPRIVKDYWVYFTMTEYDPRRPTALSIQGANNRSGKIYICRQSREQLGNPLVRCFNGGQSWVTNDLAKPGLLKARPIHSDPRGVSWSGASLSYIPRNKKYLLITEHTQTMSGSLQFLEADTPWGPYRTVLSSTDFNRCTGSGGSHAFFARHDPRWSQHYKNRNPAARLQEREVLVYTGVLADDAMKTVLFSLERNRAGTRC